MSGHVPLSTKLTNISHSVNAMLDEDEMAAVPEHAKMLLASLAMALMEFAGDARALEGEQPKLSRARLRPKPALAVIEGGKPDV